MKENLTLEIVEEQLKEIAKAHGLDLMDERVPWHYGKNMEDCLTRLPILSFHAMDL